jgi:hypothetical protein
VRRHAAAVVAKALPAAANTANFIYDVKHDRMHQSKWFTSVCLLHA